MQNCVMDFVRMTSAFALAVSATTLATAVGAAPAHAEGPVMHQVTYSVFTERPFKADIYYRDAEPAIWSDYSHNPYEFSPKIEVQVGPDNPWVLNVQLANPNEWAMVIGTSGLSPNPPYFHCVLAIDGVVVKTNGGTKGALCSVRMW